MSSREQFKATTSILFCLTATACSGSNFNSIYRQNDIGESHTIISQDAKQRNVIVTKPSNKEGTQSIICAEPSPDFATVLAAAIAANVNIPEGVSAALSASSNETGANIGLRTQSIQLLRDSAYRICEAYAAGAIDVVSYSTLLRRNQVFTTAILAVEQLTGAVQTAPVAIGGSASILAGEALVQAQALVEQQRAKAEQAMTQVKTEEVNVAKLKADPAKVSEVPAAEKKLADARAAQADAEKNLVALEQARDAARQPSTQLASIIQTGNAQSNQTDTAKVSEAVAQIVASAFNESFMLDFCQMFWTKSFDIFNSEDDVRLDSVCRQTLGAELEEAAYRAGLARRATAVAIGPPTVLSPAVTSVPSPRTPGVNVPELEEEVRRLRQQYDQPPASPN